MKIRIQELAFNRDCRKYKVEAKPTHNVTTERNKKFEVATQISQKLTLEEDKKTEYYRTLNLADTIGKR